MGIIIALIVFLIIIVVVVSAIQQRREQEALKKRVKIAKQKAIIEECEQAIVNSAHLPSNPKLISILNLRSLNSARAIKDIMPESKYITKKIAEFDARHKASEELANHPSSDGEFIFPDNEQQLINTLKAIKKIRLILRSEAAKGALDPQVFAEQEKKYDLLQLKMGIESILKRANKAMQKQMIGTARQYYEKAIHALSEHHTQTDYSVNKLVEVNTRLAEISDSLKNTNASDVAQKAKDKEDELDQLFQPKQKW